MYMYIVKKGDTLWDIAKKYKTTVSKIANINNIVELAGFLDKAVAEIQEVESELAAIKIYGG